MSVSELIKAAKRLGTEDLLKLRKALDRLEEDRWERELDRVSAKQKGRVSDAKIDELVLKRRYRGRPA